MNDKTLAMMLYRLFWLTTQASGVARYDSDIILFTKGIYESGAIDLETAIDDLRSYLDSNTPHDIPKIVERWGNGK